MTKMRSISAIGLKKTEGDHLLRFAELFTKFSDAMNLPYVQYVSVSSPNFMRPKSVGTAPQALMDEYDRQNLWYTFEEIEKTDTDDFFVPWNELRNMTDDQTRVLDQIKTVSGNNGVTLRILPKPASVYLVLASRENEADWLARRSHIIWKGMVFGQRIHQEVLRMHNIHREFELTREQKDCLTMVARGMNVTEIAVFRADTEKNIIKLLSKSQSKLKANSHPHTVAKAMALGLIHV